MTHLHGRYKKKIGANAQDQICIMFQSPSQSPEDELNSVNKRNRTSRLEYFNFQNNAHISRTIYTYVYGNVH